MKSKIIEAENVCGGGINWGKFMLAQFDAAEWSRKPAIAEATESSLLRGRGWIPEHTLVLDLQTGEGAIFRPGGSAVADLNKHAIWVCPLFEPFLVWLYQQPLPLRLETLPELVKLPRARGALCGYRRTGAKTGVTSK